MSHMIQATWLYYVLFGKTNLFLVLHLHWSHWLFIRMPLFIRIHSFIRAIPLAVWWMIGFAVCDNWMQKSVRCKMIRLPVMVNRGGEFIRAFGFSSKPKYNFRVNFTYIFFRWRQQQQQQSSNYLSRKIHFVDYGETEMNLTRLRGEKKATT